MNKPEKLLDEFIERETMNACIGSGDDLWYVDQIRDYINKQRPFWLEYTKFVLNRAKS